MIVFCLIPGQHAHANDARGQGKSVYSTTGTIIKVRRNRVVIEEDGSYARLKFYYMKRDIGRFKAGDRVRVYYGDFQKPAISIKRLTKLEYNASGQNLGYIWKKSDQ